MQTEIKLLAWEASENLKESKRIMNEIWKAQDRIYLMQCQISEAKYA